MISNELFAKVTQQIVDAIEAGAEDYQMPWHRWGQNNALPVNVSTGRAYRGINTIILWAAAETSGYQSGNWGTYRQWKQLGGQVRRCERSTAIVFWRSVNRKSEYDDDASALRKGVVAKAYCVFNLDQVDGLSNLITSPTLHKESRISKVEECITATRAVVIHGGDLAYYSPSLDIIYIPHYERFRDRESYYSVLAHECIHWSGARHRLDRNLTGRFGSESYAIEELVAELGSAFIAGSLGISVEPRVDHAAYIASWLKVLHDDPRAILAASAKAQAAVDYLMEFSAKEPERELATGARSIAADS